MIEEINLLQINKKTKTLIFTKSIVKYQLTFIFIKYCFYFCFEKTLFSSKYMR